MTLQYRPRSAWEDQKWQHRIWLCKCLVTETVDWWCRADCGFPVEPTVASVLFIFSPKRDAQQIPESNLRAFLSSAAESATSEYAHAWPNHAPEMQSRLINDISAILCDAEQQWTTGSLLEPSVESVTEQIVAEIVAQQYVVFHHTQTTRRDGGFYGNG